MSNALQVYSAMLSVGFCIGFLLTALDWSILGLHWVGSREQVSSKFIILLLLLPISKIKLQYCEAQGKGRARGGWTQEGHSKVIYGWWMVDGGWWYPFPRALH